MTDDSDDKVKRLPVKFRNPAPPERVLVKPYEIGQRDPCQHHSFIVDPAKNEVECAQCKAKLNPIWVLTRLSDHDRDWAQGHDRYAQEMARLAQRSQTKCRHCGKMTRISDR